MSQKQLLNIIDMEDLKDLEEIVSPISHFAGNYYNEVNSFEKSNAIIKFFRNKKKKPLKKEYLRAHIIRKHKKLLRLAFSAKRKNINDAQIKKKLYLYKNHIDIFNVHAIENKGILIKYSKTEEGPLTDGKTKNKSNNFERSYNTSFCIRYFQVPEVVASFLLMIDILFADRNPDGLCKIFKYYCCGKKEHSRNCLDSWELLFEFYTVHFLAEIEKSAREIKNNEMHCEAIDLV